jgi:hypothetical protein
MSHTEYSAQFVQYSSVFLGLEEAPLPNDRGFWARVLVSALENLDTTCTGLRLSPVAFWCSETGKKLYLEN